jgi:hypothetical protein
MKKKELFYRYESTAPCRGDTDCPRFYWASPTGVLFGVGGPSEPAHLSTPVLVRRVMPHVFQIVMGWSNRRKTH